jgi:hypothetical protein
MIAATRQGSLGEPHQTPAFGFSPCSPSNSRAGDARFWVYTAIFLEATDRGRAAILLRTSCGAWLKRVAPADPSNVGRASQIPKVSAQNYDREITRHARICSGIHGNRRELYRLPTDLYYSASL